MKLYERKFAMVIVKKRASTGVFLVNCGQYNSPPPSSVVDTVVTQPEWLDVFLISQSVWQGSRRRVH